MKEQYQPCTVSFQRCWRWIACPCWGWWDKLTEWRYVIWWKLVGEPARLETWILPVRVGDGVSSPRTSISSSSESTGASLLARDSRPPLREKSTGRSANNFIANKLITYFCRKFMGFFKEFLCDYVVLYDYVSIFL